MKRTNFLILLAVAFLGILSGCKKEIIVTDNISTNTTWTSKGKYVIDAPISIQSGATLTIEPGTKIEFGPDGRLDVGYSDNATFIAVGTEKDPIIFTSNHPTPAAGAWDGIYFWSYTQSNSKMEWCEIEYAGRTDYAINMNSCKIAYDNCKIKKSGKGGIKAYTSNENNGGFVSFTNNTFQDLNDAEYAVSIQSDFIHTLGTGNTYETEGIEIYDDYYETTNKTWLNQGVPYYVTGNMNINGNLTIAPGTTFKVEAGLWISVGYYQNTTLICEGTAEEKITFTSEHETPTAGAWQGLEFWGNTQATTSLKYVDVLYAGLSNDGAIRIVDCQMSIQNCHISDAVYYGIKANDFKGFKTPFSNNTIENCGYHMMVLNLKYLSTLGTNNTYTAAANMGIELTNEDYSSTTNQTWIPQSVPYYVTSSFNINGNLTIADNCIFKCDAGVWISLGYYSNTNFTANNVTFTSSSETPNPGDWQGMEFWGYCQTTNMTNCHILYAGANGEGNIKIDGASDDIVVVNLSGSEVAYSSQWGVWGNYSDVTGTVNYHDNANGDYYDGPVK